MEKTKVKSNINNNTVDAVDKISDLPDHVLHLILSSLEAKQVVQTSLLSTRWKVLYCSVPTLKFDRTSFPGSDENFESSVNSVLESHDGSVLQKLKLSFERGEYSSQFPTQVNSWIIYAISHNVKVVNLMLALSGPQQFSFRLKSLPFQITPQLFKSSSLRVLKLDFRSGIALDLPESSHLPVLQTLHFQGIKFRGNEKRMEALFSSCPVLDTLVLCFCQFKGFKYLKICIPPLLYLHFDSTFDCPTEISTPRLACLQLRVLSRRSVVCFTHDLVSLDDAFIGGIFCSESSVQIIRAVRGAKFLYTSVEYARHVADLLRKDTSIEGIQTRFCNLKWLKLSTKFTDGEVLVIKTLLKYCPSIKTLSLKSYADYPPVNGKSARTENLGQIEAEPSSEYQLPHLKFIETLNFQETENEIKFLKFLLDNAISLVTMLIDNSKTGKESVQNELLKHPQASSTVQIRFI